VARLRVIPLMLYSPATNLLIRPMTLTYDIFKLAGNGERVWLETAETLDAAMARAHSLRENFPGEYLLVSQGTGKQIRLSAAGGIHRS